MASSLKCDYSGLSSQSLAAILEGIQKSIRQKVIVDIVIRSAFEGKKSSKKTLKSWDILKMYGRFKEIRNIVKICEDLFVMWEDPSARFLYVIGQLN